jgi:hypothetical protein
LISICYNNELTGRLEHSLLFLTTTSALTGSEVDEVLGVEDLLLNQGQSVKRFWVQPMNVPTVSAVRGGSGA